MQKEKAGSVSGTNELSVRPKDNSKRTSGSGREINGTDMMWRVFFVITSFYT